MEGGADAAPCDHHDAIGIREDRAELRGARLRGEPRDELDRISASLGQGLAPGAELGLGDAFGVRALLRLYPAHAAFGGYKQSGIGRENHRMMLNHYQQTKNLLVSYSPKAMEFF
jgi:hypothetical protein